MPSYFSDRINSPHDVSPISDRTKVCQPRRQPRVPRRPSRSLAEVTTMTCADPRTARTLSTSIGLIENGHDSVPTETRFDNGYNGCVKCDCFGRSNTVFVNSP